MKCSAPGIPFNCDADLVLYGPPNAPCSATIDTNPSVTLAASVASDLQSDITLALGGGQGVATSSAVTADGEGNFGGVAGEIPTGETGQPPVQTADGAGNFGGAVGEIPASEAGQEPVTTSTTDSIAQTTEQAAPRSGQASINVGDQGAVIVSINPDGADGTLEAVSIASLASGAGAEAEARREADRAAILRQRADSDTTSTDQPAITPAPKYNPRGKRQQKLWVHRDTY
ncbi:hypothetical protein BDZ45DRAFT_355833 [Acephala macrosclerotiorum]|nr:hypothetical protein BDZ45DRAFT_355833 [Acephala macrosclerotiorum]